MLITHSEDLECNAQPREAVHKHHEPMMLCSDPIASVNVGISRTIVLEIPTSRFLLQTREQRTMAGLEIFGLAAGILQVARSGAHLSISLCT
jgi:F0F1-type ATP synthase assembly protein I